MEKVLGVGGIFFKARDAKALRDWYRQNLGIDVDPAWGGTAFENRAGDQTVWTIFEGTSKHFEKPFMVNYRVASLERMLAQLRAAGAQVEPKTDEGEFGKFGWVADPEGNRIELWEPPPAK